MSKYFVIRPLFVTLLIFVSAGCGLLPSIDDREPSEAQKIYARALRGYKVGKDLPKSIRLFNQIVSDHRQTRFFFASSVALADIYAANGELEKASEYLSPVLKSPTSVPKKLMGRALLLYSDIQLMMGNDELSLSALIQAESMKGGLMPIKRDLYLPARLAVAYSRAGEDQLAQEKYLEYLSTLTKIKRNTTSGKKKRIANLLSSLVIDKVESNEGRGLLKYVRGMRYSQQYLVQIIELGLEKEAFESKHKIESDYFSVWIKTKALPGFDKHSFETISTELLAAADELEDAFLPFGNEVTTETKKQLLKSISNLRTDVNRELIARLNVMPKTPEAIKFDRLNREGEGYNPYNHIKPKPDTYLLIDLDEDLEVNSSEDPNLKIQQ
jgi:tetratricopeptide (TPR) repeat protein